MTIPTYLPYFVLAGTAGILVAVLYGLNRALAKADWPAHDRTRTVGSTAAHSRGLAWRSDRARRAGVFHVTRAISPPSNMASSCRS